jgi:hypothetical protein
MAKLDCGECIFREVCEQSAANPAQIDRVTKIDVPGASEAVLAQARDGHRGLAEGLNGAVEDCPGYSPIKLRFLYYTDRLIERAGKEHSAATATQAACNNPFIKTPQFRKLFQSITVEGLQWAAWLENATPSDKQNLPKNKARAMRYLGLID